MSTLSHLESTKRKTAEYKVFLDILNPDEGGVTPVLKSRHFSHEFMRNSFMGQSQSSYKPIELVTKGVFQDISIFLLLD